MPTDALKVPVVAPAASVTLAGTASAVELLAKVTAAALAAALLNAIVQLALWPAPSVLGEQVTDVKRAGETMLCE